MVRSGHPDLRVRKNKHGKVESHQNFKGGEGKGFFFFLNNFYVQDGTLNKLHRIKLEYVNGF